MNVRFSDNQIRFRFKSEELTRLQQDELLVLKIQLPEKKYLQFTVQQQAEITQPLFDYQGEHFTIQLPVSVITQLLNEPSQIGLIYPWIVTMNHEASTIMVHLQSDLKRHSSVPIPRITILGN